MGKRVSTRIGVQKYFCYIFMLRFFFFAQKCVKILWANTVKILVRESTFCALQGDVYIKISGKSLFALTGNKTTRKKHTKTFTIVEHIAIQSTSIFLQITTISRNCPFKRGGLKDDFQENIAFMPEVDAQKVKGN